MLTPTRSKEERLLLPAAAAAEMLSMGRSTFWNKVKERKLPQPVRIAGITRWRVADLVDFVEKTSRTPMPEDHSSSYFK